MLLSETGRAGPGMVDEQHRTLSPWESHSPQRLSRQIHIPATSGKITSLCRRRRNRFVFISASGEQVGGSPAAGVVSSRASPRCPGEHRAPVCHNACQPAGFTDRFNAVLDRRSRLLRRVLWAGQGASTRSCEPLNPGEEMDLVHTVENLCIPGGCRPRPFISSNLQCPTHW